MNVVDYVKQHKHINYCECVITKDGQIFDAIPSHIEKLIELSGKSKQELSQLMPIFCAPLEWLLGYTGCVSVWFDSFLFDSLSQAQLDVLGYLSQYGVLATHVIGRNTDEHMRCQMIQDVSKGLRDSLPDRDEKIINLVRGIYL